MKPRTRKETIKRMGTLLWSWIKQLFNAMMEASARYHEVQTKQPERKAKEGLNLTERKAARRQKRSGFDRRSI